MKYFFCETRGIEERLAWSDKRNAFGLQIPFMSFQMLVG